ncbi:protein downstream neighbor of son homolog [Lingula anatina]|uniref:Protein downstream neighbor of son homolog n=1 Tax=Lingula anatina TaxID=7574 RepID=A0A1S3KGL5_LINAN|nr:protein downstream neighbor of son homolog [Lingula anatina]|eukprot:XP_013421778.1 protein downstream neighbor of son homolog [Lingula anatina]
MDMALETTNSETSTDGSPPKWKNPAEVMKMRKRKKAKTAGLESQRVVLKPHNVQNLSLKNDTKNLKRRNPFSCTDSVSNKRLNAPDSYMRSTEPVIDARLFSVLDQDQISETDGIDHALKTTTESLLQRNDGSKSSNLRINSFPQVPVKPDETQQREKSLPCDWSLRLKMRFTSPKSFAWCGALKGNEEASGIVNFTCCNPHKGSALKDSTLSGLRFQEACMYWIHPNIPWLRMFPRITGDVKISNPNTLTVDEDIRKHLLADWIESFTSVFQLVRANLCPYFYVCTHQFSVLFRAAGIGGSTDMDAILTPSTRGLREAMQAEGIEFTLPLRPARQSSSNQIPNSQANAEGEQKDKVSATDESASRSPLAPEDDAAEDHVEEDIEDTDGGAQTWLESLGVDKTKFPELEATKVKLQREGFRAIDNRPESTVYVEGNEVQALYNFLLNCKSCIANTGAQTGIPPTILSPVAFKGATLKSLKVHQGKVRQQATDGSTNTVFMVEVVGPILPHTLFKLCRLFESSQEQQFSAVCHVHEPTVPFNGIMTVKKSGSLDTVVDPLDVEHYIKDGKNIEKQAIREIACDGLLYSWTMT